MKNGTWKMVELLPGKKVVGCKWVFKIKYKADGTLDKNKVWLVTKRYTWDECINYEEIFAPITKMKTIIITFAMAP